VDALNATGARLAQPDGNCRRRLRSCGRGGDLGSICAQPTGEAHGTEPAFDHAGNVAIAVVAASVGYAFSQRAVFLLVPVFAGLVVASAASCSPSRSLARLHPCSNPGRWSSSAFASCCSILPLQHCCRWWDRSSPPHIQRGDSHDVGLHRRRAGGDAADRRSGRTSPLSDDGVDRRCAAIIANSKRQPNRASRVDCRQIDVLPNRSKYVIVAASLLDQQR
jgi:hypothetical protein